MVLFGSYLYGRPLKTRGVARIFSGGGTDFLAGIYFLVSAISVALKLRFWQQFWTPKNVRAFLINWLYFCSLSSIFNYFFYHIWSISQKLKVYWDILSMRSRFFLEKIPPNPQFSSYKKVMHQKINGSWPPGGGTSPRAPPSATPLLQ